MACLISADKPVHISHAEQSFDLAQNALSVTHSTTATLPSIASTTFSKVMSAGDFAKTNPPLTPRIDRTKPALFNGFIKRLMYFSDMPCDAAISRIKRGVSPYSAKSSKIRQP